MKNPARNEWRPLPAFLIRITSKKLGKIFDRYKILDSVEMNGKELSVS